MGAHESPEQEMAWITQRIQELRKERIGWMEFDTIESQAHMDEISARIRRLNIRYGELTGVPYEEPDEDDG